MKTAEQIEITPGVASQQSNEQAPDKNAIHPFHVNVPEAELTELRTRINATKWPERETVADATQGAQLARWRKAATLRPGNNHNFSPKRSEPASGRCANQ